MELKTPTDNKTEVIRTRASVKDKNIVKQKAALYTKGNISAYLLYAALNFVPGTEDFKKEEE